MVRYIPAATNLFCATAQNGAVALVARCELRSKDLPFIVASL